MKKSKRRRSMIYHKVWKSFACFFIIMLMVLSMMPNNMLFAEPNSDIEHTTETTDEPQEVQQEEKEPEKELRGAQDLSKQTELLNWQIDSILVKGNEEKPAMIKSKDDTLDLSKTDAETIKELQLLFTLQISEVTDEHYLQKGDTLSITLPKEFVIDEVKEPVAIFTYDQKVYEENGLREEDKKIQIGEYTLDKEHILHITFTQAITKEDMSEVFAILPITFSLPKDQKDLTTITFPLQEENKNLSILLPVQKTEEVKKEEPKEEQPKEEPKTEPTKDEPVSDDKTEANTQPKEETVEKTDKEKPTENVKDEVKKDGNLKPNTTIKQALISTVRIFPSNVQDKILQTLASSSPYKQTFVTDLPDGFESVKISVINKNGGYTITSKDKTVKFSISASLNDDFLYETFEQVLGFPGAPVLSDDYDAYEKAVSDFLNTPEVIAKIAKLEYTFDLGDNFVRKDVDSEEKPNELKNQDGIKIGGYWIEDGVVHIKFDYEMYKSQGVFATANVEAELNSDVELTDKPKDVEFENEKLVLKEIGSSDGEDGSSSVPKYSIEKDAPLSVIEPKIEYTIDLKANDSKETLVGKQLVDNIPSGLKVKELICKTDNQPRDFNLVKDQQGNVIEPQQLTYKIPAEDILENSTTASYKVVLELNENTYQSLINNGSLDQTFMNKASLMDEDMKNDLATSEEVSTKMKVYFLKKDGQQQDVNGTRFNWTITANTKLPTFKEGYLVDTFVFSDHKLLSGTSITIGNDSYPIDDLEKIENVKIPFGELSVEKIRKDICENVRRYKPFYYIYDNGNNNDYEDDEQKEKQFVLIIPFDKYHGGDDSKEIKVRYNTELNLHGNSMSDFLEKYPNVIGNKNIGNIVNLLWENTDGIGPNPVPWDDVTFSKDVNTNIDVMQKKGISYDPLTQNVVWHLEVNKMGAEVKALNGTDVTIDDMFPKGAYDLSTFEISYTEYERATSTKIDEKKLVLNSDYTFTDADTSTKKLTIKMPELSDNQYRVYRIQAVLKDPNVLSVQGKGIGIVNKAKINATVNGKNVNTITEAEIKIDNTLIIKDAVGGYDYKNHLFKWKVTVNPNKLDIKDALVTDTLEKNTSFDKLESVKIVDRNGNETTESLSPDVGTDVVKFDLNDISGKTYILTFTTQLDNTDVLNTIYKKDSSEDKAELNKDKIFENNVVLTGKIIGSEDVAPVEITNASDAANVPVKPNRMDKGGIYNPDDGSIAWTIYINKGHANLKGLKFVENLKLDDKPLIHELDQDSVKIHQIQMNPDGSINTENKTDVTDQLKNSITIEGYESFSIDFGDQDNKNTYMLTFTTYLNEAATGAEIANEVYLDDGKGNQVDNSNTSDGGYDGSYDFKDMAQNSPRPKVAIRKVSSNSTNIPNNANLLLNDAKFQISAYEITNRSDSTWKINSTPISKYTKLNLSTKGMAYFLNIMNKDNIVYKLEETEAPLGYIKNAEPVYFYFMDIATHSDDELNKEFYIDNRKVINIRYGKAGDKIEPVHEIVVENTPLDTAKFSFTKQIPDTLKKDGTVANYKSAGEGYSFLLHGTGDLNGKIKDRIFHTDNNGQVTIDALDPGTYELTEIKSNTYYNVGGKFNLTVSIDNNSKYNFELQNGTNANGLTYDQTNNILKNDYVRGNLIFKKFVQYQDGEEADHNIVKGNQEPLADVEFTLTADTSTTTNAGYANTATSGDDGTVTFANIPVGEYTLKEIKKDGYDENSNEYKVTVKEVEDKNNKLYDDNGTAYNGKKAEISINPLLDTANNNNSTLYNTPEKGTVTLTKVMNNNDTGLTGIDDKTLEGVEFGLYRKINGIVASEPVYNATSDSLGKVEFVNVEYGDYVCKEITDLPDFEKYTSEISMNRGEVTYDASIHTFSLNLGNVQNQLYKTNVKFHKQDQDNNSLSNVKFKLYRRSSEAITNTSTLTELRVSDDIRSYYPYLNNEVSSDDNGDFTLSNIPVGDYLLIENSGVSDLQDDHNKVAIHINITKTSVDVKFTDTFKETLTNDHYASVDESQWSSINSTNKTYNIVNQRKFAQIQINKIYGELDGNSYTKKDYSQPLAGAKFLISTRNENKTTPLIYATTNSNGNFDYKDGRLIGKDENGEQINKRLYYGSYTIKEISTVNGYEVVQDEVDFDLNDDSDTASHGGTAWLVNEGKNQSEITVSNSNDQTFIDPIIRSKVSLTKLGNSGQPLTDAEFTVKDGNTEVAYLTYKDGNYVLTNSNGNQTLDEKKGNIPYLYKDGDVYKLLSGTYQVEESKTPAGYRKGSFQLNISDTDGTVTLSNPQNCDIDETTNEVTDLPIILHIEKQDLSKNELTGAEFSIKGEFVDGEGTKTLSDAIKLQLKPNVEYTIIETQAPNGYIMSDKQPIIKFDETGKVSIENNADNTIALKDNTVIFKNAPIQIDLLKKEKDTNKVLANAEFTLKGTFANTTESEITGLKTDDEGNLSLYSSNWNLIGGNKYTLTETKAPDGYILAPDITFTVKKDGTITDISNSSTTTDDKKVIVENTPITASLKKIDATNKQPIEATFNLYDVTAKTNKEFTTVNGLYDFKYLVQGHTYQITEVVTPVGYEVPKDPVKEFTVQTDGTLKVGDSTIENNLIVIENIRKTGKMELIKVDSDKKTVLEDAEFTLTGPNKYSKILTTNKDGKISVDNLSWGEYTLVETKAPNGYKLDAKEHKFTIDSKTLSVSSIDGEVLTNQKNSVIIQKTDMNSNKLSGATFSIKDVTEDFDADEHNKLIESVLNDQDSQVITLEGVLIGGHTYELSETKAPDGYQRVVDTVRFKMNEYGAIKNVGTWDEQHFVLKANMITVKDNPITATLVKKDDKNNLQSGVEFTIKPAEDSKFLKTPEQQPLITNDNGEIVLDGYLLQGNTYIVHEEKALNGYSYEEDRTLTVNEDGIVSWSVNGKEMDNVFTDHALKFDIVKVDDAGNKIKDKLFKLTDSDGNEWAVISNAEGVLIDRNSRQPLAKELAAGKSYTLEESKMENSPYINLHSAITFDITRQGTLDNVEYHKSDNVALSKDSLHLQITNVQTTANFKKVNAKGEVVVGAKLAIYADTNGEAGNEEPYSWTTDKDIHTIKMLPQGTYWLKEVETPYGYITANPIQFTMDGKGELSINNKEGSVENQTIIMTDELVKGHVKIEKQSDQGVALSDVVFDLYHADGKLIAQNLTTDKDGNWYSEGSKELSAGLEAGKYYIQETKTQDGYQLPENNKTFFTIAGKDTAGIITQPDVISVEVKNQPYQRTLHIVKKDIEDDAVIPNTMFTLQRIKDGNGKEVTEDVMTKVTGEDGTLSFTMNQKGTYRLSETTPANGYVLGKTPYVKEFVLDDTSAASITLEEGNTIYNERATGVMQLVKTDDLSKEALNGAVFTLYQGDKKLGDFTTGNSYAKDASGNWNAESGEEGNLKISGLSWGDYVIKETKAADGYQLENNEASFTIGKSGTDMILEVSDIAITNLRTKFTFKKLATYVESCSDETLGTGALPGNSTKILQGAEFSAYDETGKLFASAISDEFGNVTFEKMLANHTYTIKETKVPTGYIDHKSVYQVHIDENGQCGELIDTSANKAVKEVINDLQRTDIVLKKVSETNPDNMIPNSVYGLYRMPKTRFFRSRNVDAEPQLIATAKTDQNGILRFEGVLMNQDYMIKELIAPDGSQRSEHPITITFAMKNGEVVLTNFDDGKGTAKLDEEGNIVWYEPDVIVSFDKVDEKGNPLANATLELLDKDGNVVDTWTTDKEAHVAINLLKAGEQYTLKETKAPAGYTLANDISFIVEEKDLGPNEQFVQKVTMQNTLTNLIVEKHDKDSGNVLEGAQFVIYDTHTMEVMKDYAGNELKWTSKGMDQFVGVPAGDYILKETMAPDGYQLAKDLAITLTENGVLLVDGKVVDKLVVVDERKVDEVITPTPPVDTGDQTQVNMYLAMLSVSVMALGVLIRKLWTLNRKA